MGDDIMQNVVVSVDLGQSNDFSAISIIERENPKYLIRHLERFPIGTDYNDQVERISSVLTNIRNRGIQPLFVVDRTGVGRAVTDMLRARKETPIMITITGGDQIKRNGKEWNVPKRELIAPLILAYQNTEIKVPSSLPESGPLTKELLNFKLKVTATGMDTYEAEKAGMHDDLVLSVAMGVFVLLRSGKAEPGVIKRQEWPSKYTGSGDINEIRRQRYSNGVRYPV
jgi:hypothetical protein